MREASTPSRVSIARAVSRVVLRNVLVLQAPEEAAQASSVGAPPTVTAKLILTDRQAQTLALAMKSSTWFFVLRPTNKPRNSAPSIETVFNFLGRGLPNPQAQIVGQFPESVDAP